MLSAAATVRVWDRGASGTDPEPGVTLLAVSPIAPASANRAVVADSTRTVRTSQPAIVAPEENAPVPTEGAIDVHVPATSTANASAFPCHVPVNSVLIM